MKKNLFILILSISLIFSAAGCGKNNETYNNPNISKTTSEDKQKVSKGDYNLDDYITLGQYKGIKVTVLKLKVTDDDVNEVIQLELKSSATEKVVTDRPIQNGDTVNIDYIGLKDGVAFEGGTEKGYDQVIGSGSFIPGFEDGLIGHNTGETVSLNITFPKDYQAKDLAGQAVVFNVTANSIKETVVPEFTEEYVKENSKFNTVAAYKENIRQCIRKVQIDTMKDKKVDDVFSAIVNNSEIRALPQTLLDYYTYNYINDYAQYAKANSIDMDTLLAESNMTRDVFDSQAKEYAEPMVRKELVIMAIVKAENMILTEDEFNEGVDKMVNDKGYSSRDELIKTTSESEIRESLLWQKIMDFVTEQAVEI